MPSNSSTATSFHYGIVSYDFHTYFKLDNPEEVKFALELKQSVESEFKNDLSEGNCRSFDAYMESVGPHTDGYGMFEVDTKSPGTFLRLLNYYQTHHRELSVLIHPRTDKGDLIDHTTYALWLGTPKPLKTEIFKD
ncbi:CYFA0S01e07140g1_1 [Cyberlindnera fabianii]|uniref:CYFA0S01e07140g1_1 n=1 Tax=Cyberlindnera fabianii TaxID=36022 RepID=A0A061AP03_CYBFA|nr:DOPA 4,5-dioxygenase [Cyberlindnera fabianii]CDR37080.1 CYFA0S01e07140g1_1 [Cyberlindnera fabianii]